MPRSVNTSTDLARPYPQAGGAIDQRRRLLPLLHRSSATQLLHSARKALPSRPKHTRSKQASSSMARTRRASSSSSASAASSGKGLVLGVPVEVVVAGLALTVLYQVRRKEMGPDSLSTPKPIEWTANRNYCPGYTVPVDAPAPGAGGVGRGQPHAAVHGV